MGTLFCERWCMWRAEKREVFEVNGEHFTIQWTYFVKGSNIICTNISWDPIAVLHQGDQIRVIAEDKENVTFTLEGRKILTVPLSIALENFSTQTELKEYIHATRTRTDKIVLL